MLIFSNGSKSYSNVIRLLASKLNNDPRLTDNVRLCPGVTEIVQKLMASEQGKL